MAESYIKYRSGYKYQLVEEYQVKVSITPKNDIKTDFIELSTEGMLVIKKGYAWDGPSGPTIDTPNFMRGSLVHDALYQLLRNKLIDEGWRDEADEELRRICIEDGMSKIRAWWVFKAVRKWGKVAASPESRKKTHKAP
ncbi:MAG TPA: DUF1353 domain-containing protein [Dehalococcoidia bacterium]|nr:DUF1353 domain-containing protein [Dehalococcoidia bacterium]